MARPSVVAWGALAGNESGNLSPTIPTHQADDILIARMIFWGPNTAGDALDIPTPASWNLGHSQGGGSDVRHAWFWRRATGAGTTVTFTRGVSWDTGSDTEYAGRVGVIRNCRTSGNPFDSETTQGTETQANAVWLSINGGADRMHLMMMATADEIAAPTLSGYTVDWSSDPHGANVGVSVGFLTKNVDGNTETGGSLSSAAVSPGNYVVYQAMMRPQTITGAAIVQAFDIGRVVSGAYTRRGAIVLNLTLDRFFHAWQQHYGAVVQAFSFNRVVSGQSVIFGRATGLQVALNRVVQGNYTRRGRLDATFVIDRQVIGRGSFRAIAHGVGMVVG